MTEIKNYNLTENEKAYVQKLQKRIMDFIDKYSIKRGQYNQYYKELGDNLSDHDKELLEKYMNITMLGVKLYVENLSHNIKKAQKYYWEHGIWTSKAPIGYKNYRDKNGKAQIKVDPNRADKILKLFEARAKGLSLSQLKKYATELNLTYSKSKPYILKKSQISRILHNPIYIGTMIIKKVAYPHNYPKIVNKELFDKVQQTFKK